MIDNSFAGIVITAQSFNPSIFTETWMHANGIIEASRLEGVRLFSPEIAQFQTNEAQVLITPPKMQITFRTHSVESNFENQRNIATRTVQLLPHTPFLGLGLNFDYFVLLPPEEDFIDYDRKLLGTGEYKLIREFDSKDARFGRYFSKDYDFARMKLEILPVKAGPENKDMLKFGFNFHHEVSGLEPKQKEPKLIELIGGWNKLYEYSAKLVETGSRL